LGIVRYPGKVVLKGQQFEYYSASKISSAVECFAAVYGDRHHRFNLSVGLVTVYLENQNIVLVRPKMNPE
jgi:hypothetical protein